jgi:hypothetical protein
MNSSKPARILFAKFVTLKVKKKIPRGAAHPLATQFNKASTTPSIFKA